MTNKDAKDCQGGNKGRDKVGRQGGEERGTVLVCYLAGSGDRATKEMYSVPALFEVWEIGKNGGILSNHSAAFPLRERWKKRSSRKTSTSWNAKGCQGGNKRRDKVGRQGGEERGTVLVCYLAGSKDRATKEMYSVPALFKVWEIGKNGP
ncbi:hypothetical protein Tco_0625680 [Tanacetum coccineum]|uniref:Uncharacterized protein n=1 Tax=Tanacetum coccineum TaxID=301880 RepID=A0ABQ4WHG2_9ASTR